MYGWTGKILRLDLGERKMTIEPTAPYVHDYVGGKAVNAKILFDEMGPEAELFDPQNRLIFGNGVLTGTGTPSSSRIRLTSISRSGLIRASGMGGFIGPELKWAGFDHMIIQGKSDNPVYIYINNDSVEFRDATHIWGKDTWTSQKTIKQETGDGVQTLSIGPAGERMVSFGTILSGQTTSAGRDGMGAVMGAKNLKAVAIRGTQGVKIAKPAKFLEACRQMHQWLKDHPRKDWVTVGDTHSTDWLRESGQFVIGNWETDVSPTEEEKYHSDESFWDKYAMSKFECCGCPMSHSHLFNVPGIGIASSDCRGWPSFLQMVWNTDHKVAFHANYLADYYGVDCVSLGNIIGFLMELHRRGIITEKDTDGIAMQRGDADAIIGTIHKIGRQEGFGKLFKDGIVQAVKTLGRESEACAMHVKGMECFSYPLRAYKSISLSYAIGSGDGVNERPMIDADWVTDHEEQEKWFEELYGEKPGKAIEPTNYEKKALMTWDGGNRNTLSDMLGVCKWITPFFITPHFDRWVELFNLATGWETTEEILLQAAQRSKLLERAINVTRGIRRKDDTLPKRFFETKEPGGLFKGEKLDKKKFAHMIDEYYELRGWDKDGVPTQKTFKDLNMTSEWRVFQQRIEKKEEKVAVHT